MSSRLDPLAATHTTPTMAAVQRCAERGRLPVSTAFYLAKYRGMDLDDAMRTVNELTPRPHLDMLMALGRNFTVSIF